MGSPLTLYLTAAIGAVAAVALRVQGDVDPVAIAIVAVASVAAAVGGYLASRGVGTRTSPRVKLALARVAGTIALALAVARALTGGGAVSWLVAGGVAVALVALLTPLGSALAAAFARRD
jgi:hypothetical protein